MALRTYGDKPLSFQLEEGGEYYYVGSEVNDAHTIHNFHTQNNTKFNEMIPGGQLSTIISWIVIQKISGNVKTNTEQ